MCLGVVFFGVSKTQRARMKLRDVGSDKTQFFVVLGTVNEKYCGDGIQKVFWCCFFRGEQNAARNNEVALF